MFLCLGKCQRKKFPLRVGFCLQDFKPLIWTITAPVSGNWGREVPAKPEVLEVRTVIRALVLIRVQSSGTLGCAHARAVSVHHSPGVQGSGGAEAPGDVNTTARLSIHPCQAQHSIPCSAKEGCAQQSWQTRPHRQHNTKPDLIWGEMWFFLFFSCLSHPTPAAVGAPWGTNSCQHLGDAQAHPNTFRTKKPGFYSC